MGIGLSTVNTGEGASSGGSVQQYTVGSTAMGATSTGVVFIGINATTARAIKVDSAGVVAVSGGGGGVQYSIGETSFGVTGTGTLFIGVQSGATTGRGILLTTTGSPLVTFVGTPAVTAANVTIASITTGTVSVVNTPTVTVSTGLINISGTVPVTLASLATVSTLLGTVAISGTVSGSTIATVSTLLGTIAISGTATALPSGTQDVSIVNTPTVTATYATVPTFIQINYTTLWNAYVVATTSAAAGVIIKTSGAHTLYVTDLVVAATGPNDVNILSETTVGGPVAYLATKGGFVYNARTPFVCTSAQSLRVVLASSGSVTVFAAGYTVT